MQDPKNQKIFRMQPILCPWITSQPYHSSLWNKNRGSQQNDPSLASRVFNNPWVNKHMLSGMPRSQDKPFPSIQQSSSQFFYFLRLMQLFPDTHPATLHTVLVLCKNDFFCAVDKMLYAKRCKLLCYKKNLLQKTYRQKHHSGTESVVLKAHTKMDCQRHMNQVDQEMVETAHSTGQEGDSSAPSATIPTNAQERVSLIINSFAEKPEDLSTIKQCCKENTPFLFQ